MATEQHEVQLTSEGIHTTLALGPYADAPTRRAVTLGRTGAALAASDVGKDAQQSDNLSVHTLVSISPVLWRRKSGPPELRVVSGTTGAPVIADVDNEINFTSGSAITFTIPLVTSLVGIQVGDGVILRASGAGTLTIAHVSGSGNLHSRGGLVASNGQHSVLYIEYMGSDIWAITGDRA